ncbi:MAG: H/ACA ribonucleoprotein complex subunit GAR1 [Candidatus Heimdallarchaeota archaeon]
MPAKRNGIHLGTNLKVVHDRILFQGNIKPLPKIGAPVFDSTGTRIGKIQDIIGPIARPWIVVKQFKKDLEINSDSKFYASKGYPRKEKRRKRPRQNR